MKACSVLGNKEIKIQINWTLLHARF